MANYVGVKCPVCNKRFAAADDIVVCPICGAPHHRHCYAEAGDCAYVGDHISGKEWRHPEPEQSSEPEEGAAYSRAEGSAVERCPRCGSVNPSMTLFCQVCGARMTLRGSDRGATSQQSGPSYQPYGDPFGGVARDESIGGLPVSDVMFYVGPNSAYYIPRFYTFEKLGNKIIFNFSALILNFFYFFYRKMYAIGAILFLLFALGMVPMFLYIREVFPQTLYEYGLGAPAVVNEALAAFYYSWMNIFSWINFTVRISFSCLATRIYYNKVIRDVSSITGSARGTGESGMHTCHDQLVRSGGVDKISVALLVAVIMVAFFFVTSAITYSAM